MISDPTAKADITRDWDVIRRLCNPVHRTVSVGAAFYSETRPEESYNLPLVLAYSCFDEVLKILIKQNIFTCEPDRLGARMNASRTALDWRNYEFVDEGRLARNRLAHEGQLASRVDCIKFITAIEDELRAWGVL